MRAIPDFMPEFIEIDSALEQDILSDSHSSFPALHVDSALSRLQRALRAEAAVADEDVTTVLKRISPTAAVTPAAWDLLEVPADSILSVAGLDRLIWVIAVGGGGSDASTSTIRDYVRGAERFVAVRYLLDIVGERNPAVTAEARRNHFNEALRRHFPTEIRFVWASHLLLTSAADAIAEDSVRYHSLAQFSSAAIEDYFDEYSSIQRTGASINAITSSPIRAGAMNSLGRLMATPAGSASEARFSKLLLHRDYERFPFVEFGSDVLPISLRGAGFYLEQAFFEVAKRQLADGKARAQLYEETIRRASHVVAPSDFKTLLPPIAVPDASSSDPGEVDFGWLAEDLLVLGEAKAHFVASEPGTSASAFVDQCGKATRQLNLRLSRVREGFPVNSRMNRVCASAVSRVLGLAVPLHSYGAAVWDHSLLRTIGALSPHVALIPLHQLVILLGSLTDARDLRRYLFLRSLYLRDGVAISDESDLLRVHLTIPTENYTSTALAISPPSGPREQKILQPYAVRSDVPLSISPMGLGRETWRRAFVELTGRAE